MKTLLMIRHAKSSWENFTVSDFERPLNARGHRDAPEMAERLLSKNLLPEFFISSTALRTRQTTEHFCKKLSIPENKILWEDKLYHASPAVINLVISSFDNHYNTIAVVCHNPGITEFVNSLTENINIDDMPTCGVFAVTAAIEKWEDFSSSIKNFQFFDYPKNS